MFNISTYLEKFKNIGQDQKLLKEIIISAINETTNIKIDSKNIKVKNAEIFLNISPAFKNAIYIKKDLILNKIKEKTKENIISLR